MKIIVLAAVLLILGLGLALLLKSTPGEGPVRSVSADSAPVAPAGATDMPLTSALAAGEDKLATPTDAEPKRAGVETADDAGPKVALSGRVQVAPGCGDDDRIEVFALVAEGSLTTLLGELGEDTGKRDDGARTPKIVAGTAGRTILARAKVEPDMTFRLALPAGTERVHLLVLGRYAYTLESTLARVGDAQSPVLVARCGCAIAGSVSPPPGMEALAADLENLEISASTSLEGGAADLTGMDRTHRNARVHGGHFEFRALDPHTGFEVETAPKKLAAATMTVTGLVAGRTQTVDVVLQRGGTLQGVVKGPGGVPLAGATVEAKRKGHFFGFDDNVVRSAESGPDGTFELAAVWPGRVIVTATSPGCLAGDSLAVDVVDGAVKSGLVVELNQGKSITGQVTWTDGKPAAGVDVDVEFDKSQMAGMNAFNAARGAKGSAKSDASGQFIVTGLGAGPFTVRANGVSPEDMAKFGDPTGKLVSTEYLQHARKDGVKPGAKDLVLVLSAPQGVRGLVVDASAQPIAKFHVRAASVGKGMLADAGQDEVEKDVKDETGAFLVALPRTGAWKITVESAGYAGSTPLEISLPLKEDVPPLVITLQRAAIVHGIVQDPTGTPIVGASVETATGEPNWKRMLSGVTLPSAKTTTGGEFALEGLAAGHMALVASSESWAKSVEFPVDLAAGETREGVVLVLREGGKLTGEIYEGGKGASGLLVQATLIKTVDQKAGMSDAQGRFELAHLEPGAYQVIAMPTSALAGKDDGTGIDQAALMSKLKMTSAQIEDGKETHVVMGAPPQDPVQVHGHVMHAGAPFTGATVMFIAQGKEVLSSLKSAPVGKDGAYTLTLDGPGAYGITVQKLTGGMANQSSVEFTAKVPAEKDFEYDITMPTGRISGQVRGEDGAPTSEVSVQVAGEDGVKTGTLFGGQYHLTVTDGEGRFDFEVVRPGKYTVSAGGDPFGGQLGNTAQHARKAASVHVDEGQWLKDVDFKLEKPGTVVVTVVDERGDPVSGATVFARDPEGRPVDALSMTSTGAEGTAKYTGLAAGRHTFSARTKDHTSLESPPVDVESGASKSVKLSLVAGTRLLVKVLDKDGNALQTWLSVTDEAGREVANMIGMAEIQEYLTGSGESRDEMRIGPLGPGKYRVRATRTDGKTQEKSVNLGGAPERKVTLRFED